MAHLLGGHQKLPRFEDHGITGMCLRHNPLISGGVTVGTIFDGWFNVSVTAKVRKLGERCPNDRSCIFIHMTRKRQLVFEVMGKSIGMRMTWKCPRWKKLTWKGL